MAKLVSSKRGTYCEIVLDGGSRILIDMTRSGVRISKLGLGGWVQTKTICEWEEHQARALIEMLAGPDRRRRHPLRVIAEQFVSCRSIHDVSRACHALEMELRVAQMMREPTLRNQRGLDRTERTRAGTRGEDRRAHKRYRIPLSIRYAFVDETNGTRISPVYRTVSRDIGLGGVSGSTRDSVHDGPEKPMGRNFRVSNLVKLQIRLPGCGRPIIALGRIIHGRVCRTENPVAIIMGIRFIEIQRAQREKLRLFLEAQACRRRRDACLS